MLLLAGVAGIVFLLPALPAHAAASVALTTITTTNAVPTETAATSGTVGSTLVITGQGFVSNVPIEITSTTGTSTITWLGSANNCNSAFASSYGGIGSANSLYTLYAGSNCLTTSATGAFKVSAAVPALPGGAQTIVVSDGTNTVSSPFTVNAKIKFTATSGSNNFGFPLESIAGTLAVTGFGSGESVTVATPMWSSGSTGLTCTTGTTPGGSGAAGAGSCNIAVAVTVADTTGGAKTLTATGATSGLTATTTYTVNPWAVFYDSAAGKSAFSFIGSAPTSLLIEVHGMTAQTVAASTITVGGIATSHSSFTIGSTGAVGGAGGQVVVSPTGNVPFGQASVVIAGTTFSYASGNILLPGAIGAVTTTNYWGGVLLSSIIGTSTSTGVMTTASTNYKPGPVNTFVETADAAVSSPAPIQNQIGYFGYGFVNVAGGGGLLAIGTPTGAAYCTTSACTATGATPTFIGGLANNVDANGAVFATALLADTPWSTSGTPTTAASYTATTTQAATAPANILSPSWGITPWVDTSETGAGEVLAATLDYATTGVTYTAHGFGATDIVTAAVGGSNLKGTGAGMCTAVSGNCVTAAGQAPDLAAGLQNLVLTGSVTAQTATATGAITYDPRIDNSGSGSALNIVSGVGGSTTILRSGTNYGVHGLLANTAYSIIWNGLVGTSIGTFTSTATGGIPVPGVQVTIPADISGIHPIDIQQSSATTTGTSFIYGNTLAGDFSDADSGLGATYNSQYGDMLYNEGTTLVATPTVANVGGSISITGTGLASNTLYDLGTSQAGVGSSSPATPSTCALSGGGAAGAPTTIVGSFTSSATGTVPAGVKIAISDGPTYSGLEQGTLYCVFAQTGPNFGTTTAVGVAQFELQANENLNMTTAPVGHNVQLSAHALNANKGYNVLFAPYACGSSGAICGTVVGAVLSNAQGAGLGTFTVPGTIQTAAGAQQVATGSSFTIELQPVGASTQAIASPATLTVASVSTTCNTTSCVTANGAPTVTQIGNNKAVQTSFTNNSNGPITAIVYAIVHNAQGQTVAYSTATLTNVPSGGSATAYDVLFGLAPGTYSVTIFATSTSGTAISGTSTVTVTI